jgi:hypothetical protein
MMNSLEVEDEVATGRNIRELELSFILLNFFEAKIDKYLILLLKVKENLDIKLVGLLLNLHPSKRTSRDLPLKLFELNVSSNFIESCFSIEDPSRCENNKPSLSRAKSVLL